MWAAWGPVEFTDYLLRHTPWSPPDIRATTLGEARTVMDRLTEG